MPRSTQLFTQVSWDARCRNTQHLTAVMNQFTFEWQLLTHVGVLQTSPRFPPRRLSQQPRVMRVIAWCHVTHDVLQPTTTPCMIRWLAMKYNNSRRCSRNERFNVDNREFARFGAKNVDHNPDWANEHYS